MGYVEGALFAPAVAVVIDGASLTAYAALLVREHGIADELATVRLADGEWVTVDGSASVVEVRH